MKKRDLGNAQAVIQHATRRGDSVKAAINRHIELSLVVKKPLTQWTGVKNAFLSAGLQVSGLLKGHVGLKSGFELAFNA